MKKGQSISSAAFLGVKQRTAPRFGGSRVLNIWLTESAFSLLDYLCKNLLPLLLLLCISRQSNIFKLRQHIFKRLLNMVLQIWIPNHTDPIQHITLGPKWECLAQNAYDVFAFRLYQQLFLPLLNNKSNFV